VELKNAQKRLSHLQRMTCLGITGGMRSTPTSALEVMLMLPPLHLFIKQKAKRLKDGYIENYLSLIFRKINDFVHRFILDHKSVDFTILVVNCIILYS
jgi:hypothetical protein